MINRKIHCAVVFLVLLIVSPLTLATKDADNFYEMKKNGSALLTKLESLPYASEGKGPVMYMFEYSECPYCQAMYRDFNDKNVGIEFRRFFVPVSQRTANETAALGKSRNIKDYRAFMEGRKRAPGFTEDNDAINAYNTIVKAATKDIPLILRKNGWPLKELSFPQYFWVENGKVYSSAGYGKKSFEKAISRVLKGANNK